MKPIEIIANDLFDKVRSRFSNLKMGNDSGSVTADPTQARFFDFDFAIEGVNLGRVSISINDIGNLKIFYSQGITEDADPITQHMWYDFLKEMRFFAKRRLLRFDTRDITKGNLDKTDFQYLAQNGKENNMNESALTGSSKTSYRTIEDTDLIIRHSEAINPDKSGSRSRKIKNLFIQNKEGERFKFPFVYLPGARAMQRHVANGGFPHDENGKHIIKACEEILKLSDFGRKVKHSTLNDNAHGIIERAGQKLKQLRRHIESMNKQSYYESWLESFTSDTDNVIEMDDATMESYKDAFTVNKFDEALTDIFPMLHAIMQEAGEIDLDDIMVENESFDGNMEHPAREYTPEVDAFESWTNTIESELDSDTKYALSELLDQNILLGADGTVAIEALQGIGIQNEELEALISAKAGLQDGPNLPLKNAVSEWLMHEDPEFAEELGLTPEDPVAQVQQQAAPAQPAQSAVPAEEPVAEDQDSRKQARLWQMITDYEKRAKATKNDIKKSHFLAMAQDLRYKLKSSDDVNEAARYGKKTKENFDLEKFKDSLGKSNIKVNMTGGSFAKEKAAREKIGNNHSDFTRARGPNLVTKSPSRGNDVEADYKSYLNFLNKKTGKVSENDDDGKISFTDFLKQELEYNKKQAKLATDENKKSYFLNKISHIQNVLSQQIDDIDEAKKVIDRKTGKEYDPEEEFHKFLHDPKTVAALKRMKDEKGRGWPQSSFHKKDVDEDDIQPDVDDQDRLIEKGVSNDDIWQAVEGFLDKDQGTWTKGRPGIVAHCTREFGEEGGQKAAKAIMILSKKYPMQRNERDNEGFIGGVIGGVAGGMLGGPLGAMTGYSAGSKAGDDLSNDENEKESIEPLDKTFEDILRLAGLGK